MNLDDGGIYKGRSNQRERAREVEETRHTKVDLPVDYREVETVEVNYRINFFRLIISVRYSRTNMFMAMQAYVTSFWFRNEKKIF